MIINNKQINIWRGSDVPPTLYHIWLFNESELKIYNGVEWITIIDSINIAERLIELSDKNEKEYNQQYIGKEVEVLLEEREGEYLKGHTTNYMVVKMKTNENLENTIQKIIVQ